MATSVLLATDGTYPCYRGGVSVWCDQLIRALSDVQFHVFAVTYSPSHTPLFSPPANLVSQHILPLWGTEEPGPEDSGGLLAALLRKTLTTDEIIRSRFLPAFRVCLQCLLRPDSPPEAMAA